MRTPGPDQPSLKLVDSGAGRGAGHKASLEAGASISMTVRERLGGELYRVAIGGRLVTVSSSAPLELGALLKAKVERAGDGLLLRLVASEATKGGAATTAASARDSARGSAAARAAALFDAAGLPNDAASRAALAAVLREGLAPEARSLARVRRAALRDSESGGEATDLAAKMEAKGLSADDGALDEILSSLGGGDGGRGDAGGRSGGKDSEAGREALEGGADARPAGEAFELERDFEAELPEAELPRFLAALIRAMVSRSGGDRDSLSLFNHLRGPEGSWVLVPFRFDVDAVDFAGSFRIQLPYVRGGQGRFEAFFRASRDSVAEDWSFFLNFGGGRAPSLRIEAPKGGTAAARASERIGALAAELAAHSCSVRIGDAMGDDAHDRGLNGAKGAGLDLDA